MTRKGVRSFAYCVVSLSIFAVGLPLAMGAGRLGWLERVPAAARINSNPLAGNPQSIKAGSVLYREHCARCHGVDAEGKGRHPSLRSARVHHETDGELQWLLQNGARMRGMPAYRRMPENQRWQLVSYIRSLPESR